MARQGSGPARDEEPPPPPSPLLGSEGNAREGKKGKVVSRSPFLSLLLPPLLRTPFLYYDYDMMT
jgi:hypothetical protein